MEISQALSSQIDEIINDWMLAVGRDEEISEAKKLTYYSLRNSLPRVLEAIATLLSDSEEDDVCKLIEHSLDHGEVRAQQGYDPEEVVREYHILRDIIFVRFGDRLKSLPSDRLVYTVRTIDKAIDEAIARSFKSYVAEKLQAIEQLYAQLSLTNQQLNRLVRSHEDSFSHLAHELKTPLNSIIGYSNLFLRTHHQGKPDNEPLRLEFIERVVSNGQRLLALINDALEMSRSGSQQVRLSVECLQLREPIDEVVGILQPLANEKGVALAIDYKIEGIEVYTDSLRLEQILTNLISNAIRYTDEGEVKVICDRLGEDRVYISIVDTGSGIEEGDRQRIFEPFFTTRGQNSSESTGLGLAIVAQLVELLEGEIQVESEVGVGTTFTVTLPVRVSDNRDF